MNRIAINDANIFIDLETAGLLEVWFQLGYETVTSDLVVAQLEDGQHATTLSYIRAGAVTVRSLGPEQLMEALALNQSSKNRLEVTDCAVLILARELNAILLTGDKLLRSTAEGHKVEVHGTLWIFEKLIQGSLLNPRVAADKLEHLLESNRFLPSTESKERINRWRQQSR